jgi:sugar phosphate isomerase/epimerase
MLHNRRSFISSSAITATSLFLSSSDAFAMPVTQPAATGFSLNIMAPYWGFDGTVHAFCEKAKTSGYDGIEILWPADANVQQQLFAALKSFQLAVGFLCRGDGPELATHLDAYQKILTAAVNNGFQKPLYINAHSGKDYFSNEDNLKFIDAASEIEKTYQIPVYHETHRGRMLYAAPAALPFFRARKDFRITLDISHWCCVSESLLEDQQETVNMALNRTAHIHSRIGHPEGPQVGDPRAPEWKAALDAHFAWWDRVVAQKKEKGEPLTMLTEFGPPSYMPTIPFTNQPVANQWEINVHMMHLWRKRYL